MKKTLVYIQGKEGRMEQEILEALKRDSRFDLENNKFDVLIDFSSPEGAMKALDLCLKKKKPLLCGTTGLTKEQAQRLKAASKKIAIFYSPNLSMGLNAMIEAMIAYSKKVKHQKIKIEETHHIHKKDAPSGTALYIKRRLEEAKLRVEGIESRREGEVFGVHKVIFEGNKEKVFFEHQAESRSIFAEGSLNVAVWLKKKKTGFYDMTSFMKKEGAK